VHLSAFASPPCPSVRCPCLSLSLLVHAADPSFDSTLDSDRELPSARANGCVFLSAGHLL
jgi:hypothetical protein